MGINQVTVKMPDANSVAAGTTAVFQLPVGRTYHKLWLNYAGVTLAQLNAIRLVGNGSTLMEFGSGAKLDARNKFDKLAAAAGILTLNFERQGMHLTDQRMLTVLGTGFQHKGADAPKNALELAQLQVEVDIDAAAAAPVLSMYALQTGPQPLNYVRRVVRRSYTAGASGEFQISDLPKNNTTHRHINRIFIESANLTNAKVEKDNFTLFDRTVAVNNLAQSDGERTPQANYFVIDPTEDGLGANVIDVFDAQDLRLKLQMSAGETIILTTEYLGIL